MRGLHLIQYPSGRWGFVGRVPQVLACEGDPDLLETARLSGPGIAARFAVRTGRTFRTLSWATELEARDAAALAGYEIGPDGGCGQ